MSDPVLDDDSDLPGYVPPPALEDGADLPGYVSAQPEQPQEPMGVLEQMAMLGGMEPGGGRDYQDPRVQQAQMDVAGPSLWSAAKVMGPMALPGGQGLPFLAKTGVNALGAGASSAAITALEDERWKEDPEAAAWAALASGGEGALVGGLLSGAATGVENAAQWAKPYAQQFARRAQSAVEGLSGSTFRNLAKDHGFNWTKDELAQRAIDTAPKHFLPKDTAWYKEAREAQQKAAGAEVGAAVDQLTNEVPDAAPLDELTSRFDDQADQYLGQSVQEERAKAAVLNQHRDNVAGVYGTGQTGQITLSPRDLQREKMALTERGYPDNATMSTSDADRATLYRDAASVPRQLFNEAAQRATPETQAMVSNAMENFASADTLADSTARKANMDQSQARGGLWEMLTGAARDRMPDATSLAMQGAGAGLGSLERWAASSQPMARLGGSEAGQVIPGNQRDQRDQQKQERDRIQGAGRGHMIEGTIEQLLDSNPELFGDYESRFLEARGKSDPMAMSTLLQELQSDDKFRIQVLPQIQKATSRAGDF